MYHLTDKHVLHVSALQHMTIKIHDCVYSLYNGLFLTHFQVVRGEGNSLNNRFLPFSNIKTDAVLSLDDDVCLTHEDILQGFKLVTFNTLLELFYAHYVTYI